MRDGFQLGNYRLESKLAMGGMAEIWLATRSGPAGFSKKLVLKKILPHLASDSAFVDMFLNEGRLAAMINHPNVVQVFELGEEAGDYYLVMEYVDGVSLRWILGYLLEHKEQAPIGVVAYLFSRACRGLHAAHELHDLQGKPVGLVHRDMSPENILISRAGEAKVSDFGVAKATLLASFSRPGHTPGKLHYMAPEQLLGKPLDRRADLFAIGVCLFETLTGERVFKAPADALLSTDILSKPPPSIRALRPEISEELAQVVERAMQKDRDLRWPNGQELAQALEEFAAPQTEVVQWLSSVMPPPQIEPPPKAVRTKRLEDNTDVAVPKTSPPIPEPVTKKEGPPQGSRSKSKRSLWWGLLGAALTFGVFGLWRLGFPPIPHEVVNPVTPPVNQDPPIVLPVIDVMGVDAGPSNATTVATQTVKEPILVAPPVTSTTAKNSTKQTKRKGTLVVRVSPWADVLVDGQMLGATPIEPISLPAGRHTVTVTNSELGKTRVVPVEIRGGQQQTVEVNLSR